MSEPKRPSVAVLIVEDEPLIRMGAVYLIEDAGFEVHEACSADAAIALLELHAGALFVPKPYDPATITHKIKEMVAAW